MKTFDELTGAAPIVAMVQWQEMMIIATGTKVYAIMKDGTVELMKFSPVGELAEAQDLK